jgi:hypothetical protein
MPRLADLKRRFPIHSTEPGTTHYNGGGSECESNEEKLVEDNRACLSPTQCVEQKLQEALNCGHFTSIQITTRQRYKPR